MDKFSIMFVAMYIENVPFNVSPSTVTSADRKPATAGHNSRQLPCSGT